MPEVLVVLAVMAVALAAWLVAWSQARNPANISPQEDAARLRQHAHWLEQRLEVARRENWGDDMEANLVRELEAATAALAARGRDTAESGSAAR